MILPIIQIIIAVFLIIVILFQVQGSGLSAAFGSGGEFYRSKRSVEQMLQKATIILAVLFGVVSIALLLPAK